MKRDLSKHIFSVFILALLFIQLIHCQQKSQQQNNSKKTYPPWQKQFKPFGFGSNKPHLIFNLGSRDVISYNLGYGYWLGKSKDHALQKSSSQSASTGMFSDIRYKYQNTQQQLYVNVLNHDGDSLIHQEVLDNRYKVQSNIKYLYSKMGEYMKQKNQKQNNQINEFEYQIQFSQFNNDQAQQQQGTNDIFTYPSKIKLKGSQSLKQFQQGDLTWFINLSIQNNQLKFINHKDYASPICYTLQRQSKNSIKVHIQQLTPKQKGGYDYETKQTIKFKSHNLDELKMFGFTVNISQAYLSQNYLNQFKHLVELDKYQHLGIIERKNDTKLVEWENKQIQQIKKGQFDSKYTYVIIYGTVSRKDLHSETIQNIPSIYVTNSTKKEKTDFQSKTFDILAFQNQNHNFFRQSQQNLQNQTDKKFVKHVIFNLLGGQAYYQGKLYTQNSIISHQHDYSFTFTPSRLIFPRSFLWDDGFHNTVVALYKPQLVMKILHNWFKKIDLFGWIGRQQIRGFEIGAMMPDNRFVYQDVFQLNPPTIVLPLLKLIQNKNKLSQKQKASLDSLLSHHYHDIQKHFRYFIKTQSHYDLAYKQDVQNTIKYRWRCKDQCAKGNFMGSGLDDYPRVQNKTQISKQHIDLSSWLWFFSDSLETISKYLSKEKSTKFYNKWKYQLKQKIMDQCLDQIDMLFKDLAVKGEKLYIDQKVTKIGYINLFPFMVGLLQTQQSEPLKRQQKVLSVLKKTIQIMMDQQLLMSLGGIRSLSKNDTDYASQQNYWRGAVWMPLNYMILRACKKYYWNIESIQHREQVHKLYNQLRKRLIETVRGNYQKSGYLFENYIQGEGNRGYPFYGWTSLIASIMLEDY